MAFFKTVGTELEPDRTLAFGRIRTPAIGLLFRGDEYERIYKLRSYFTAADVRITVNTTVSVTGGGLGAGNG